MPGDATATGAYPQFGTPLPRPFDGGTDASATGAASFVVVVNAAFVAVGVDGCASASLMRSVVQYANTAASSWTTETGALSYRGNTPRRHTRVSAARHNNSTISRTTQQQHASPEQPLTLMFVALPTTAAEMMRIEQSPTRMVTWRVASGGVPEFYWTHVHTHDTILPHSFLDQARHAKQF